MRILKVTKRINNKRLIKEDVNPPSKVINDNLKNIIFDRELTKEAYKKYISFGDLEQLAKLLDDYKSYLITLLLEKIKEKEETDKFTRKYEHDTEEKLIKNKSVSVVHKALRKSVILENLINQINDKLLSFAIINLNILNKVDPSSNAEQQINEFSKLIKNQIFSKEALLEEAKSWKENKQKEDWSSRYAKEEERLEQIRKANLKAKAGNTSVLKYASNKDRIAMLKPEFKNENLFLDWHRDFNRAQVSRDEFYARVSLFRAIRDISTYLNKKYETKRRTIDVYKSKIAKLKLILTSLKDKGYTAIDYPDNISFDDIDGGYNYKATTPFLFAAHLNNIDAMKLIMEYMPDTYVNAQDKQVGYSALFYGVYNYGGLYDKSKEEVLDYVLKLGIDPNLTDNNGATALMMAVALNNVKAFEKILSVCGNKIDLSIKADGQIPLQKYIDDSKNPEVYNEILRKYQNRNTGYEPKEIMDFSNKFMTEYTLQQQKDLLEYIMRIILHRTYIFNNLNAIEENLPFKSSEVAKKWYSDWGKKFFGYNKSSFSNISVGDITRNIKKLPLLNLDYLHQKAEELRNIAEDYKEQKPKLYNAVLKMIKLIDNAYKANETAKEEYDREDIIDLKQYQPLLRIFNNKDHKIAAVAAIKSIQ